MVTTLRIGFRPRLIEELANVASVVITHEAIKARLRRIDDIVSVGLPAQQAQEVF